MLKKINKFLNLSFSRKLWFLRNQYYKFKTQTYYKLLFNSMGKKSVIRKPLFITPDCITVGDNVVVWEDARIEGIYGYVQKQYKPHIILENGVSIQQRCHFISASTLKIGKNTIISFDVMITDTDHEYNDLTLSIGQQPLIVKHTVIGKNCFIGSGVKIQAGTVLGRHCIVGANAVVRGIFEDYSVIVGVPARVVKRYDTESKTWRKTDDKGQFIDEI